LNLMRHEQEMTHATGHPRNGSQSKESGNAA